jgi:soluble lytic murein transglycosylase-like protein
MIVFAAGLTIAAAGRPALSQPQASEQPLPACLFSGTGNDGKELCIRADGYNLDLCRTIEHFAATRQLPPDFFARLIWRESLFRPNAISPKGAEGIAQFMPGTAKIRGLGNSFDVIEALDASSRYLNDLRLRFGNLGLAAAAYNAGEGGLSNFLTSGNLPFETRAYVMAITGSSVEEWQNDAPKTAAAPLDETKAFIESCVALADTRRLRASDSERLTAVAPWGVQLAAHPDPQVARRLFASALARLPSPLQSERVQMVRQRGGNFGHRQRYAARIGRETRAEASTLCDQIRKNGGTCTVLKN